MGLLLGARQTGLLAFENIVPSKAKKWLPVNVFFVLMLLTGFFSQCFACVPALAERVSGERKRKRERERESCPHPACASQRRLRDQPPCG